MQKVKTIPIGTRSFTLKELPVRVIWELINNSKAEQTTGPLDRLQELLHLACPELTEEVLLDLYPSEIEELWQGFEEVNGAFLGAVRRIGLDKALSLAMEESITSSMTQFASSLPAVTVPLSGTTATASS
jgi:hypothetical protein